MRGSAEKLFSRSCKSLGGERCLMNQQWRRLVLDSAARDRRSVESGRARVVLSWIFLQRRFGATRLLIVDWKADLPPRVDAGCRELRARGSSSGNHGDCWGQWLQVEWRQGRAVGSAPVHADRAEQSIDARGAGRGRADAAHMNFAGWEKLGIDLERGGFIKVERIRFPESTCRYLLDWRRDSAAACWAIGKFRGIGR